MKCAVCNGKYSRHCTLKVTLSKYDMANELVRTSLSGVYTDSDRICKNGITNWGNVVLKQTHKMCVYVCVMWK